MLSRIANSLFWMGRYLSRAEQTALYTKIHYFSCLDAPLSQKKEFVLESVLTMTGIVEDFKSTHDKLIDEEVVFAVSLDEKNPVSIKNSINYARENARGARDSLSGELWEAINKFYHFVNNFTKEDLQRKGMYYFSEKVAENCSVVHGTIDNSLIHNEVWAFIRLGIHIERASLTARMLITKINDIQKIKKQTMGTAVENYQCVILLKSAEAFDMSRTHYKAVPNMKDTLEFLILNNEFPRSIRYNLNRLNKYLGKIHPGRSQDKESIEFLIGKVCAEYNFLKIEEIETSLLTFLNRTLDNITKIADLLNKRYLNF